MQWAEWLACTDRTDCYSCRQVFQLSKWDNEKDKEEKKNGPPCKTCKPEAWPINEQVLALYHSCQSQVIMSGMSGAVAINEIAVLNRIRLEGIKRKDQKDFLNEVVMVANRVISLRNEKNRTDRENR